MRWFAVTVGIGLCLAGGDARAQDGLGALEAEAQELLRGEDPLDGVRLYARAVAAAQKKGDLLQEGDIARAMQDALERADALRRRPSAGEVSMRRQALHAAMTTLDAKHAGAFVSAECYAASLLLGATREGDTHFVKDAAAVLAVRGKDRKAGKCAAALASYGEGMLAIAEGRADEAPEPLQSALDAMVAEGWGDLAVHVGTELAATHLAQKREIEATSALGQVAGLFTPKSDTALVFAWRRAVAKRLAGAPEAVLAPFTKAMEPFDRGSSAGGAGGAGGRGGAANEDPRTHLARAYTKFSKSKPLISVKRTEYGFEIRYGFNKEFKQTQRYGDGVNHQMSDDDGVTLSFFGKGVRLARLSLKRGKGGLGGASSPGPWDAFRPLAEGETWSVDKKGRVSITSR